MAYKIYLYDNNTGLNIPETVDTWKVNVLLGSSIDEIHNAIDNNSKLFVVATHISDSDFIVKTDDDKKNLESILKFGKYNYTISVKPKYIWYTNKVDYNIIISDTVKIEASALGTILKLFLQNNNTTTKKVVTTYSVIHTRTSEVILTTPSYTKAKEICDKCPCTVIVNNTNNEEIYRSGYGKVKIPYTKKRITTENIIKVGISFNT